MAPELGPSWWPLEKTAVPPSDAAPQVREEPLTVVVELRQKDQLGPPRPQH